MLWDDPKVAPVPLDSDTRNLALILSDCEGLLETVQCAMDLASFNVMTVQAVTNCIAAITMHRPDIVLIDTRLAAFTDALHAALLQASVTETLPVLPIGSSGITEAQTVSVGVHGSAIEIFLKTRAVLRRVRPIALKGQRYFGRLVLDEPQFKLFCDDIPTDLSKTELCLLGPFFDVAEGTMDRHTLTALAFLRNDQESGSRLVDFQVSRMRRRLNVQLGSDPLRSVRGIGYALARA